MATASVQRVITVRVTRPLTPLRNVSVDVHLVSPHCSSPVQLEQVPRLPTRTSETTSAMALAMRVEVIRVEHSTPVARMRTKTDSVTCATTVRHSAGGTGTPELTTLLLMASLSLLMHGN